MADATTELENVSQYDNTNTGIISKNERKESDKHPDIRGSINIEGREYWLDGWRKERKSDGATFYSLRAKPKDEAKPQPAKRPVANVSDDDEIPF